MSVQHITETLQSNLHNFAGLGARVCFDLGEDGAVLVDATAHPPKLEQGAGEADCTIRVSAENMGKLIDGSLNPMMAFTLGKLKVDGSMGIAMKIAGLLEE